VPAAARSPHQHANSNNAFADTLISSGELIQARA